MDEKLFVTLIDTRYAEACTTPCGITRLYEENGRKYVEAKDTATGNVTKIKKTELERLILTDKGNYIIYFLAPDDSYKREAWTRAMKPLILAMM